jgi:hypothetical protein
MISVSTGTLYIRRRCQLLREHTKGEVLPWFYLRFQVLTAISMKMAVFWDIASCCLLDID